MSFNIDEERIKLIRVVNDEKFDFPKLTIKSVTLKDNSYITFLLKVLVLTIKYPQVELYLRNLLNYFTVHELENIDYSGSILHCMCRNASGISLNSFEIIINYGIDLNIERKEDKWTAAHTVLYYERNNYGNNILNLLIKHGINLNIIDYDDMTILDLLTLCRNELNECTKNCIMTIIDFGGITNNPTKISTINPSKNSAIYDFIEYYKCSTIKLAIKK